MRFELVRDSIITMLGNAQGSDWITIGFPERDQSDDQNSSKKTAQVYYNGGAFPKGKSSARGPVAHEMEFRIILTVASASIGNIDDLDNAENIEEYAAAVATFARSEELADRELDDFISKIFSTVMSAQNINLQVPSIDPETGFNVPKISDRWIDDVKKSEPSQKGRFTVIRAAMILKAQIFEEIVGIDISTLPIWDKIPYDGTNVIKGNTPQSGNKQEGI